MKFINIIKLIILINKYINSYQVAILQNHLKHNKFPVYHKKLLYYTLI